MSIGMAFREQHARGVRGPLRRKGKRIRAHAKYGIERASDEWAGTKYHKTGREAMIERRSALLTGAVFYALSNQISHGAVPDALQIGFLYTGLLSILQQFTGNEEMAPEIAK